MADTPGTTDHAWDPPPVGVVVGDDGSAQAQRAIRWALQDAARRGVGVHVVRAWTLSSAVAAATAAHGLPFGVVPSYAECEAFVRQNLEATVARAVAATGTTGVAVHTHVVHATAAHALLEASRSADVVVVGERGVGGFLGLVLGSTAEQVLRHASCPVVVVRSAEREQSS